MRKMMHGVTVVRKWASVFTSCVAILLYAPALSAAVTPDAVSKELVAAFLAETGNTRPKARIDQKQYVGLVMRTLVFGVGKNTYRIVFSSDGTIAVGLTEEGGIGAQPLWKSTVERSTVEEIVNIVYSKEFGRKYDRRVLRLPEQQAEVEHDAATLRRKRDENELALRWNRLMNQLIRGELPATASASGGALNRAMGLARASDPCSDNRGGVSAQRAAMSNVAEAMAAVTLLPFSNKGGLGESQLVADRSRSYKKAGTSSLLSDLDGYESEANEENAIRLIRQSVSDAYTLFEAALRQADPEAKDPLALAALRNFRAVARSAGEKRGKTMIDSVVARSVVDIGAFTEMRRIVPNAHVIYDRPSQRYYIDPTLNSPSEARYLVSLAVYYEWKMEDPAVASSLLRHQKLGAQIQTIETAMLDASDEGKLRSLRDESDRLAQRLFEYSESLWKVPGRLSR